MKKIIALLAFAVPSIALAQVSPIVDANTLTSRLVSIGNTVLYLLVAFAVIIIVWNVVMYIINGGNEEKRAAARGNVLWGIVGLFVIISIWGLVNILANTFRTTPANQAIPNLGNQTGTGGIPGNQVPIIQ